MNTRSDSLRPRFLFSLALFLGTLAILRMASLSAIETPPAEIDVVDDGISTADEQIGQIGESPAKPDGSTTIDSNDSKEKPKSAAIPTSTSSTANSAIETPPATKPLVAINRSTPATVNDLRTIQLAIQQAVEKALPATVGVRIGGTFGSGVIVTEDGYVLTAGHVVPRPGANATIIMPDGTTTHKAKSLGTNGNMDSGMLKITDEGKYPYVELGRSSDLRMAQWCVALGHPNGLQPNRPPVLRAGRIMDLRPNFIQTDCTIVGGDSGGPLLDTNGRVIGIHSRISNEVTENLHVPIDTFRDTWDHLTAGDQWGIIRPGSPILGIRGTTDAKGCRIGEVVSDPAIKAGLQTGDYVVEADKEPIKSLDDLQVFLSKHEPGDEVSLTVLRDGRKLELKITIARFNFR